MKKYLKILLFIALFLLPIKVHASSISVSLSCPTTATAGQKISCTINTKNSGDIGSVMISYSFTGGATYSNFTVGGSYGLVNPKTTGVQIGQPGGVITANGKLGTLIVQIPSGATSGTQYTIGLVDIQASNSSYEDLTAPSVSKTVTVKSGNNYLRALAASGVSLGFSKTKTSYTFNVPHTLTSTNITAATEDARATLTGAGTKTLNVGKNTFKIVVKAENGSTRTYTIVLNRAAAEQPQQPQQPTTPTPEPETPTEPAPELPLGGGHAIESPEGSEKDSNTKLSKLTIEGLAIPFNKSIIEYDLYVGFDVGEVKIEAEAESDKAKVAGTGTQKLIIGRNVLKVTVTAENGKTRTYEIVIYRDKEESKNENNKLKNLEIDGKKLEFDPNVNEYTVITSSSSLDLTITLANANSTYSIKGNSNLVNGSVVRVKVMDEDGNLNVYKININMPPNAKKAGEGNSLLLTIIIILLIIIGLGGIGFGVYFFLKKKNNTEEIPESTNPLDVEQFSITDTREDETMPEILSMTAEIQPVAQSIYENQEQPQETPNDNNLN